MPRHTITRRDFVAGTSQAALSAMILPRHVLGGPGYQAPSDTLNVAIVGAGGMGMSNAEALVSQNIVALCDVDFGYVDKQLVGRDKNRQGETRPDGVKLIEQFGKAARYADFREMLDKQRDLEAVVIATPDHAHAVIAKAAMEAGKHVYVQKPLTYSVHESRVLSATAARTGVVTQMGNQGHSHDDARLVNEWIEAGVIGPVHEIHVWTNRPIWPQGMSRPAKTGSPPKGMRWDLYLGPVPEEVPYAEGYHPFSWRGWTDFGVGALGDMGAHLIDHPFWALDLGFPTTVEATSTPWGGPRDAPVSYPLAMLVHYQFPARGMRPPVKLTWYDGGLMPARPDVLPESFRLSREGGVIFVGERGILIHETYGRNPKVYPEGLMEWAESVPQTHQRITTSHELNWAEACKGKGSATSPISYAARLTEVMLLGIVALRTGQGRTIEYDGAQMRITNIPEANQYLTREYRPGWEV